MALLSVNTTHLSIARPEPLAAQSSNAYGATSRAMSPTDAGMTRRANLSRSPSPSPSSSGDEAASQMEAAALRPSPRSTAKAEAAAWPTLAVLLERYNLATCTKMYDVEELIDYYFHRRLAAVPAVVVSYLPFVITPNQITLFGLAIGWAAALCLYDSEFHAPLGWDPASSMFTAGALMFIWIVSDCTDGQVARLCKRGTRTGRILDGVVDGLVIFPNCLVIGMLLKNRYGEAYTLLSVLGGLSLWIHALTYDKIKNVYMENALPQSECDGETVESVTAEYKAAYAKDPRSLDTTLLAIYRIYMVAQNMFTSDAATKAEAARLALLAKCDDEYHAQYRRQFAWVVRLASFMGISAHVAGLYVAYFAAIFYWDALYYVELYFAVALNLLFVSVVILYSNSGMGAYVP